MMKLANHRRMALLSPKMRSKVGSIVSRSRSVSLTSKTIRGRAAALVLDPSFHRTYRPPQNHALPVGKNITFQIGVQGGTSPSVGTAAECPLLAQSGRAGGT